jgi:hypothetical protein
VAVGCDARRGTDYRGRPCLAEFLMPHRAEIRRVLGIANRWKSPPE